jgi:transcription initiation factor IIF auxiliary subunit
MSELDATLAIFLPKVNQCADIFHSDKPSDVEGFPMKRWNIEVYLLDEAGNEKPASCFHRVTYNLHPSFKDPVQSMPRFSPFVTPVC